MRSSSKKSLRNGHALAEDWIKIKNVFADTAMDVREKAETIMTDSVGEIKKKSAKAQTRVKTYVIKKPMKSIGIALLVGVALGWLLRR